MVHLKGHPGLNSGESAALFFGLNQAERSLLFYELEVEPGVPHTPITKAAQIRAILACHEFDVV